MSDSSCFNLSLGDVVMDRETGTSGPVVVSRISTSAEDWNIPSRGTLADDNPDYPVDDYVINVVFQDTLSESYPHYSGIKPLALTELNESGVKFYSFPESRLRAVGRITSHTIDLSAIRPSPYHARSFCAANNRDFIASIRQRGDLDRNAPLLRPVGDEHNGDAPTFEILNGHKRVWAAHVAGLDSITARCIYVSDEQAARTFANAHLGGYDASARQKATRTMHQQLGEETAREVLS
jgi:ParB family chromosome partitioning protein